MCYEVLLIEETAFLLSYFLLSAAVIVSAILIFSSLGSFFTDRWHRKGVAEGALLRSCSVLALWEGCLRSEGWPFFGCSWTGASS